METSTTEESKTPLNNEGLAEKLVSLRSKLYEKAKKEPNYRFYALYDRIYRTDTLFCAYQRVKRNGGSAGIDGVSFKEIESLEMGHVVFLLQLQKELQEKKYRPSPVKRVYIPKSNGKLRPLGIPTIRDRVVQMATLLILEPIFEADFLDCSYGFRPNRSAHNALGEMRGKVEIGYRFIYDADLEGYFDSIPREKLMLCLKKRVTDRSVLKLISLWLNSPIVEPNEKGGDKTTKTGKGTPQGGVISPLLSNLYLHYFDKVFHGKGGPYHTMNARLVRYADDFVVLAKYEILELKRFIEGFIEGRMGLVINKEKTKTVDPRKEGASLDFLGFTFRFEPSRYGKGKYLNVSPSKKSVLKEKATLKALTGRNQSFIPVQIMIRRLNKNLNGWSNYFRFGYPSKAFSEINSYVRFRMTIQLQKKSQRPFKPPKNISFYEYLNSLGLVYLKRAI
ncbi:RNA-directed DNA polymerase [Leptospira santarosai str. HAI821]|uniref:group II intron reverse transcriptase/maturase n=1 Tax=Leptospira santarosai TaxID=28183 RepID=UPI0002BE9C6F|nr:group II intron reverse transcriptase/maturase [Leptospira santarosai]EMO33222.1 RNA-directed DNA polymerase [Leptospira santarosai str. HAI821]